MQLFPDRFEAPVASVHFNSLGEPVSQSAAKANVQ